MAVKRTGRPSKFTGLNLVQVKKVAARGWTDREMADFFKVAVSTWNNWKVDHPDFLESLKAWKAEADQRVERSLYERATGYSHPDTHISNYQGAIIVTHIIKHYPPDTTAAIFWLKNRDPENWRDKTEVDATGEITLIERVIVKAKD